MADPPAKPEFERPNTDQRGHCSTCGAGWREYAECEEPDCCWVIEQAEPKRAA